MISFPLFLASLFILFASGVAERDSPLQVVVVGAGVSGASAAYFLHNYAPFSVQVTVLEAEERVGGRVFSTQFGGATIELGADSFHEKNLWFSKFAKEFGFETEKNHDSRAWSGSLFSIWDGSTWTYGGSHYELVTALILVWKYGLDPYWMDKVVHDSIESSWQQQYRADWKAWRSVGEFLERTNLADQTKTSTADYFVRTHKLSPKFVREVIGSLTRGIYQKNSHELNALAGSISIAGTGGDLLTLRKGNDQLPLKMLNASRARTLIGAKVTKIERLPTGQFEVFFSHFGRPSQRTVDAVVLACPQEIAQIELVDIERPAEREFTPLFNTFISGQINPAALGLADDDEIPHMVMTVDNATTPYTYFGTIHKIGTKRIVRFFSPDQISEDLIDRYFLRVDEKLVHYWPAAYFSLPPNPVVPKVELAPRFYYPSAFESVMSVMESALLGGQNVAKLLLEDFNIPLSGDKTTDTKTEL